MTSRPRLREKAQVLDDAALDRALTRIAHEILERNGGAKDLAFVGLRFAFGHQQCAGWQQCRACHAEALQK